MASKQLQDEFLELREACIWLQSCYNIFNHLYNSGDETEALLRKSAAWFFTDLNRILQEYFLLQARKITDPATSLGRENLSIPNLNSKLLSEGLLSKEIEDLSAQLLDYRELIRLANNRVIAHHDKETVLAGTILGTHSANKVDSFMNNIRAYTDAVGHATGIGPLDHKTLAARGDVLDLLRQLKQV